MSWPSANSRRCGGPLCVRDGALSGYCGAHYRQKVRRSRMVPLRAVIDETNWEALSDVVRWARYLAESVQVGGGVLIGSEQAMVAHIFMLQGAIRELDRTASRSADPTEPREVQKK